MVNENQEPEYHNNNILSFLTGLLIGVLIGAVTMLLLAPQSGENTRMQIREGGREKIKELKRHGQELVVEQLEHISEAALSGKKAIQKVSKADNGMRRRRES